MVHGTSVRAAIASVALSLGTLGASLAQAQNAASKSRDSLGFFKKWQRRASASQKRQPHWITPVVTTTPRLEQEWRSDFNWRWAPNGTETTVYQNGKGMELIPAMPIEIIVGMPAYTVHRNPKAPDGWGDWPLTLKYRIISHNEEEGDDILTAFLQASLAAGGKKNGSRSTVITPVIAPGKGWGNFDVQGTFGIGVPFSFTPAVGHPIAYNVAFQYHVPRFIWPEVEFNGTTWRDGTSSGHTQLFVTPGLVFGRFPIHDRLGFTVGAGVQIAATTFHQYDHNYTLTVRMPF